MNAVVQIKENGGVGKRTWKPFSKLSPFLIFLWSCFRLLKGRYTTVCLAGETFCSLYTILSDLL